MKIFTKNYLDYKVTRRDLRRAERVCGEYNVFMKPTTPYFSSRGYYHLSVIEEKLLLDLLLMTDRNDWRKEGCHMVFHQRLGIYLWVGNKDEFLSVCRIGSGIFGDSIALRAGTQWKLWWYIKEGREVYFYRESIYKTIKTKIRQFFSGEKDSDVVGDISKYKTEGFVKLIEAAYPDNPFEVTFMSLFVISSMAEGRCSRQVIPSDSARSINI